MELVLDEVVSGWNGINDGSVTNNCFRDYYLATAKEIVHGIKDRNKDNVKMVKALYDLERAIDNFQFEVNN